MNKFSVYLLSLLLTITSFSLFAQEDVKRATTTTNGQGDQIFYHTIERGQTVYSIATMYGVSTEDIYRLNPESRISIKAGAILKIPQQDAAMQPEADMKDQFLYHTIQPKETLYALSMRYKVPPYDIMKANPGLSVATFTSGRTIRIPATRIETLPSTAKQEVMKLVEYTIVRQETMYSITRKFGVTSDELIRLNPSLRGGVKAGMVIQIPRKTEEIVTTTPPVQQEREVNAMLAEAKPSKRVDRLQVALLLPFMTEETRMSDATARFVEYYEGMLIAVDSLKRMGCSFELSVYDTGSGSQKVKKLLQEEERIRYANLIIGAVQNDQIQPIAEFAEANHIKFVIPFTSRNDDVLSNANIFQVNTPHSYLYAIAAQSGCSLFAKDNIILVNIGDKDEKTDFIKAFKSEMQQRQIPYKEINYNSTSFIADVSAVLDKGNRNIIVPTSSSLEAITNIKTPLRMLSEVGVNNSFPYQINLFGYPEWQTYTRECLEDFYALNTYIYSNFYADNLDPGVQQFYAKYRNWFSKSLINYFPKYGILGYDTGMFFFDAMRKYGVDFENSLNKIHYKSLQMGFHFERVNNWGGFINTNLFIVQYKNDNTITRLEIKQ